MPRDAQALAGRLRESKHAVRVMPMAPDVAVWGALLSGRRAGCTTTSIWACTRRARPCGVTPWDIGTYVLVATVLACGEDPDRGEFRMHEFRLCGRLSDSLTDGNQTKNQYSLNLFPLTVSSITICIYVYIMQPNSTLVEFHSILVFS